MANEEKECEEELKDIQLKLPKELTEYKKSRVASVEETKNNRGEGLGCGI